MEIKVKSSQVVKTGSNSKGDWELIKVISEDGTGYTTFDKKAKYLGTGAVVDIGEPDIKEGKISFKEVIKVIKEGTGQAQAPSSNRYGQDSPEKRQSIETMNAITNVMTSYTQIAIALGEPPANLKLLWERALIWCGTRIPHLPLVDTPKAQPKAESVPATDPIEPALAGPPFETPGQFWAAATKRWKKTQSEIVAALNARTAKDVTDFDWSWLELEKKLSPEA